MPVKKGPLGLDMTLVSVTEDRLAVLKRMQRRLSEQIDTNGDERALCLLMTRLQSVMAEIAELDAEDARSAADEIAARRQARLAARRRPRSKSG
jgi:hypothetical protein